MEDKKRALRNQTKPVAFKVQGEIIVRKVLRQTRGVRFRDLINAEDKAEVPARARVP